MRFHEIKVVSAACAALMISALMVFASCGSTGKYKMHSDPALSPDQISVLEEETPEIGRSWIILIDEEDVHEASVDFWTLKKTSSRSFELTPGIHHIVAVPAYAHLLLEEKGPANTVVKGTLLYSPVRMTFHAEKGRKYLLGGEIDRNHRWNPWIRDASSNAIVSRIIPPDPRDAEVSRRMCRIDSRHIISAVKMDDILYFPLDKFKSRIWSASDVISNPVGIAIIDTIYKTMESGRMQYRKAHIVSVDVLNNGYVLVSRDGLTPDDRIPRVELMKNRPQR